MIKENLVRLVYKSACNVSEEGFAKIVETSRFNNAKNQLTGVLFKHKGFFYQVLEGNNEAVLSLLEVIKTDTRHQKIKVLSLCPIKSRQFDLWGMGTLSSSETSLAYATELLDTKTPEKVDIAVAYLWRWLMESSDLPETLSQSVTAAPSLFKSALSENLESITQAQKTSKAYFALSLLFGMLLDAGLFAWDHFNGEPNAWRMLVIHGLSALGLVASAFLILNSRRWASGLTFQCTVIFSIAAQCIWMGYGMHAPALAYLAIFVLDDSMTRGSLHKVMGMTIQSVALVAGVLGLVNIPGFEGLFDNPVPLHHSVLVFLTLPCVTFFVARSHILTAEKLAWLGKEMLMEQTGLVKNLRTAMAARNVFFASVSHEIRTPLAGIATAVALIKHPRTTPEAKERYLASVEKSSKSLGLLLNDLLDISKLESTTFNLAKLEFDIWVLTKEVVALFTPSAQENGNEISVQLINAGSTLMLGDSLRVRQMLSNLISNANKFTKQGRISVSLERLVSDFKQATWKCSVTDSGCGIKSSDLKGIFTPFAQADNQEFSKGVGTGLGLAIVANLAKQMDGEVGVTSELGKGSNFWFSFRSL